MKKQILLILAVLSFSFSVFAQGNEFEVLHDNVIIVLDGSASMHDPMGGTRQTRAQVAKDALKKVVAQIPEETRVGILVFSSHHSKNPWVYQLGQKNTPNINRAIDSVRSNGGTPLGQYIKYGADVLLHERTKQLGYGTFKLVVVTDGAASDEPLMNRVAPEVVARGISLDVIGLDMAGKHVLSQFASSYRNANDPASLEKAVSEAVAEVSRGSGNEAEIFQAISGLQPEIALAAIGALTSSSKINHPIGEDPPKPQVKPQAKASQQTQTQTASAPPVPPQPKSKLPFLIAGIIGVVVIAAFAGLLK